MFRPRTKKNRMPQKMARKLKGQRPRRAGVPEMNHCPAVEQLRQLLEEDLMGPDAEQIEAHVQSCARCQEGLSWW